MVMSWIISTLEQLQKSSLDCLVPESQVYHCLQINLVFTNKDVNELCDK